MVKIRKKTSNRGTTRMRDRVRHKAKESHKKAKREAKRDVTWKSRVKKDPGIPNLFPYKDKILQEQAEVQRQREAEKQARKRANNEADDPTASTSVAALAAEAEDRAANGDYDGFDDDEMMATDDDGVAGLPADPSLDSSASMRAHARSLRKVLALSDVLIEVLDARDPLGTRSIQLEKEATQQGKRVMLVLNKVDLVPKENVEAWLKYLRRSWPTLPFKCSTQSQRSNLSSGRAGKEASEAKSAAASSTQPILQLLKNYARYPTASDPSNPTAGGPTVKSLASMTVGVVGFPNVGKSSLINTLKRSRACGVAPTPGYTKDVQEVAIEKGLKVLDCPGVVLSTASEGADAAERILRNAVKVEQVLDPIAPVGAIVRRCRAEHLMMLYGIPAFAFEGQDEDARTREFLVQVARSRGRVKKGGVPDVVSAARGVLRDWNVGKVPYYTVPPAVPLVSTPAAAVAGDVNMAEEGGVGSSTIVSELAPEFDLDHVFREADQGALEGAKSRKEMGGVVRMEPGTSGEGELKLLGETEDDAMEQTSASSRQPHQTSISAPETVSLPPKKHKKVAFSTGLETEDQGPSTSPAEARDAGVAGQMVRMGLAPDGGVGENKAIARAAKRDKKRKAKAAAAVAVAGSLDGDEAMVEEGDGGAGPGVGAPGATGAAPYSFAEFFSGV